jgi:hypothetical protein
MLQYIVLDSGSSSIGPIMTIKDWVVLFVGILEYWGVLFVGVVAFAYAVYEWRKHPPRIILLRERTRTCLAWEAASRHNRRLWFYCDPESSVDVTRYFDDLPAALRALGAFCRRPSDEGIEIRLCDGESDALIFAGALKRFGLECSVKIGWTRALIDPKLLDHAACEVELALEEFRATSKRDRAL